MRIDRISVSNFRCFDNFSLELGGESVILVSATAAGKTSLLNIISKCLGRDRSCNRSDFQDLAQPIEATIELSGFTKTDQAMFAASMKFHPGKKPSLVLGFRAEWNTNDDEADTLNGFPEGNWKPLTKPQREALPHISLPAQRDPSRLLQPGVARSLFGSLINNTTIDAALDQAFSKTQSTLGSLSQDASLTTLLNDMSTRLAALIPDVSPTAFSLETRAGSPSDLLRDFELSITYAGSQLATHRHSSGLGQLAVFSAALRTLSSQPTAVLLLDEPEYSLPPQTQRALMSAVQSLPNQAIIATHSSSVLDRANLKQVVRLYPSKAGTRLARPKNLSEPEAERLSRFVNPLTAEACFAKTVVLVEGYSDRVLLLTVARRAAKALDALGVTVLSLDGGCGIGTFMRLFGPSGLGLRVLGLCDKDKEERWISELSKNGIQATNRLDLATAGFMVCDADLEDEVIRTLGTQSIVDIIEDEGESAAFATFQKQTTWKSASLHEQLRRYLHDHATRWAVPLGEALDVAKLPEAINGLLDKL